MKRNAITRSMGKQFVGAALAAFLIWAVPAFGQELPREGSWQGEPPAKAPGDPASLDSLLDMADKDVGQLSQVRVAGTTGAASLDMPVSSVSRQESTVGKSPAAVFVITNEMIRRSGAKEIPEVLRMVPGMEVARIDSNKWAVSIRGFNGRFANKLLVRIDGRDVYTPLFAGTFWDVQDVLLEDVERIEVIRGPGATVWGANAVNGVINIITKGAKDTQGAYIEAGGGTYERGFTSARYGGQLSDDLSFRLYGKWFDRAPGYLPGEETVDGWNQGRGGFRMDWRISCDDTVTLQGDYYDGYSGDQGIFPRLNPPYFAFNQDSVHASGDDLVLSWRRVLDDQSDWTAKVYYDQTKRHWPSYMFMEDRDTFDFDFQYRFPVGERHEVICGCGYRNTKDTTVSGTPVLNIAPTQRSSDLFSGFVQDEITLRPDRLYLTLGSKFEINDYTGFEYQPSVRLLWTPDPRLSVWSAVSRAVRTPSRGEEDGNILFNMAGMFPAPPPYPPGTMLPGFPFMFGNPNLRSEELIAYEAGIRGQSSEAFSWDFAVFVNDYQRLSSLAAGTPFLGPGAIFLPMLEQNAMAGRTYGFELAATYEVNERWRLQSAYTFLILNLNPIPGEQAISMLPQEYNPRNQFYLQSSWDIGCNWELDLIGRYTDSLPAMGVPKYIVGDVRLSWHAPRNLELSVVGRNLFNGNFYQFGDDVFLGTRATEVQPEVYGQAVWRF